MFSANRISRGKYTVGESLMKEIMDFFQVNFIEDAHISREVEHRDK